MRKIIYFLFLFNQLTFAEMVMIEQESELPNAPPELYLDLMKECLLNRIYEGKVKATEDGSHWPNIAHTMVGKKRLDNIQYCVKQVLDNSVPGDLVETGVWRGGATIFMRAMLKAYGDQSRRVWVCDSFAGLPPPNEEKYPADRGSNLHSYRALAIPLEQVQLNFSRYGLLDNQVVFLKGFFSETLPTAPIETISVLRLDGDLYESTMDALENLYPKISLGGFIIVDDYGAIPACAQAIHDYRNSHNINQPLIPIDWTGVFWQKTE